MATCQVLLTGFTFVITEHILKKLQTNQSPALATLIYVDSDRSLPTGQWSAESSAVL